jgi:hypothetical protein
MRFASFVAVLFLGALIACDSDGTAVELPSPATVVPHVYVGHLGGSSALVAIVENEDTVIAYTCGIGDKRPTFTGWYYGVKQGALGDNLQLVNGPSGLRMRGSLLTTGGSGVVTLADGSEHTFTVEPARGNAGLYDYEDAATLLGFIRANDGVTAGSATQLTTSGIALAPNTTTSTSVSPAITTTPPTTTTAPTTSLTTTQPVAIDGTNLTVVTQPITTPTQRVITRSGPVVIFMMHGMADNLGIVAAGTKDDFVDCAGVKDTPFYGRCEWGQDVLPGIFGSTNVRAQMTALDGSDATGDQFIHAMQDVRDFPDENLGHHLDTDCVTDPDAPEVVDIRFAKHFITPGPLKSTSLLSNIPLGITPTPPKVAAFVTWRDATRGLVFSGRRVTRQIYAALRWYEVTYKVTPGVILLAQSFGGLASRFMLSNPDPAMLDATTNRENVKLCKEDLAKMDYVRDRTLYLLTLATPHEGSYLAEWGPPVKNALQAALTELRNGTANSDLVKVIRDVNAIYALINPTSPQLVPVDSLIGSTDGMIAQLNSAAALVDMQLARMVTQNTTTISPDRARRTAFSPILNAQKTLIPIYATLSRSPGSDIFDGPDIVAGFREVPKRRAKVQGWLLQTMLISDVLTRQLLPNGFGSATVAPYSDFRPILDRRARLFDSSPVTTQLQTKFSSDIKTVINTVSPWFLGKFGSNADAVITALQDAQVNVTLPHFMVPIHTDQKWTIGFNGRTADVPIPAFQCGGRSIVIDLDALARLLVTTYSTTPNVLAAITGMDLRGVLQLLAVTIQSTDAFANGAAAWFVGKVKDQIALGALPTECDAAPDNPFDVFSIAELANWKVVAATGRIPMPSFMGTGEPVSDGEMDTDGAVHSASALGFTLGRVPFFFEHNRADDAGKLASWYRIYDNPVTEKYNHGQQYNNDVGIWIRSTFLAAEVGPVAAKDTFSVWP